MWDQRRELRFLATIGSTERQGMGPAGLQKRVALRKLRNYVETAYERTRWFHDADPEALIDTAERRIAALHGQALCVVR